jgi:cytochrome c553
LYSSNDDNDDYFQEIKDEAHLIEYSNVKKVCHGRQQTNIIPGGPKTPNYSGMSSSELAEAKKEYKRGKENNTQMVSG